MIKDRTRAPVIAMNETPCLEQTLDLFAAGVDDVVRKPIHVREILARVGAIRSRRECERDCAVVGELRGFFDGRDPQLKGVSLPLPRRERRILEYLVNHRGRRVSKAQIVNSIYGIFDEDVEENVVESHISKLRKKLRGQLGYDGSLSWVSFGRIYLSYHSPDGRRFHPNLVRFGVFDKPDETPPLVDRRRAGPLLAERQKMPNFLSSRRTSPMVCSGRMENRTPYAVGVMGGGRSSAISRRMSANKCREMATSAIWNAT